MDPTSWLTFAAAVFIGSYIQSVVGFGIGMIVMAIVGASGTLSLPALTAAVSLISIINIVVALKGHVRAIDRPLLGWLVAGQIPAIFAGLWVLTVLDRDAQTLLRILLGLFVAGGSLSMMIRPVPLSRVSRPSVCVAAGIGGGLIGGMFSASGPVIGWFTYRQPLTVATIRATMLCFFGVATTTRTVAVGFQGGLTAEVLAISALAAPLVILGAWLGRAKPPPVSDAVMKHGVFYLLFLLGLFIIGSAVAEYGNV